MADRKTPPSGAERRKGKYSLVVVGVSTGGVDALKRLLSALPPTFPVPLLIVIHLAPESDDGLARLLDDLSALHVKEADDGEIVTVGVAYLAPANYHLLIEHDGSLSLSNDPPVNWARPSVDILFESAAQAYGSRLIGIILTGAANDGAKGLAWIKKAGGYTIVQEPADAHMDSMPKSALELVDADQVITLEALPGLLIRITDCRKMRVTDRK